MENKFPHTPIIDRETGKPISIDDLVDTVGDLLAGEFLPEMLWDYVICSPVSLNDEAVVEVKLTIMCATEIADKREKTVRFKLVRENE